MANWTVGKLNQRSMPQVMCRMQNRTNTSHFSNNSIFASSATIHSITLMLTTTTLSCVANWQFDSSTWRSSTRMPTNTYALEGIMSISSVHFVKALQQYSSAKKFFLFLQAPHTSVSGLMVAGLHVANERYKPYKGVRTLTKSGRFHVRMHG